MTHAASESLKKLLRIAVPLALQFLLFNSMTLIDVAMLSRTGEIEVAASGLAEKSVFVLLMLLINLAGAAGVLCAQHWGAGSRRDFRAVLALSVLLCGGIGVVCAVSTSLLAEWMMGLGSTDPATIQAGSTYIGWIAWSFIPASLVIPLESGLRTVERAKIPTIYGALEVGLNIALNYCLILGNFGFPEMGIEGAAIGSLVARTVRGVALVGHVYLYEPEVALGRADFEHALSRRRFVRFGRVAGPMLVNGLLWSGGFSAAYFIYGRLGVSEVALMTVTWGVLRFAVSLFAALGIASGIAVGHELGANRPERAWLTAWLGVAVAGASALLIASGLVLFRAPLLGQFPALGEQAWKLSEAVFWLVPLELTFRAVNVTLIMGALRAGGDVTFILVLDAVCAWGIGLPLAYLAAFHFHLPLPAVYAFALLEEGSKTVLVLRRVLKKGWLTNLVDDPPSRPEISTPLPKPIAAE